MDIKAIQDLDINILMWNIRQELRISGKSVTGSNPYKIAWSKERWNDLKRFLYDKGSLTCGDGSAEDENPPIDKIATVPQGIYSMGFEHYLDEKIEDYKIIS